MPQYREFLSRRTPARPGKQRQAQRARVDVSGARRQQPGTHSLSSNRDISFRISFNNNQTVSSAAMEPQTQEIVAGGSPAEVPNDPGYDVDYNYSSGKKVYKGYRYVTLNPRPPLPTTCTTRK